MMAMGPRVARTTLFVLFLVMALFAAFSGRGSIVGLPSYDENDGAPSSRDYALRGFQSTISAPPKFNLYNGLIRYVPEVPDSWRIWVYPLDDELLRNGNTWTAPFEGPFDGADPGYRWETLLHHRLAGLVPLPERDDRWARWTTKDPAQARAFFVPLYTVGAVTPHRKPAGEPDNTFWERIHMDRGYYARRVLNHIVQDWPHWNRTYGWDHVTVAAIDQGLGQLPTLQQDDVYKSHLRQMHVMGCVGAYPSQLFYSNRDVVLSPFETRDWMRPRILKDQIAPNDPESSDPRARRQNLAVFIGAPHDSITWDVERPIWGSLRNKLFELYEHDSDIIMIDTKKRGNVEHFSGYLQNSTFCLHLPGFYPARWSSRLAHVLAAGCVPVIPIDNLELPFEDLIDWSRAVIRISEYEAHQPGRLKEYLQSLSPSVIREKAANVRILARLLTADLENGPNLSQAPRDPDVFDFAIGSLYERMRQWDGTRTGWSMDQ